MPTTQRRKRLPSVSDLADAQPSDHIERREGKVYLVDGNGAYAPVEVRDDEGMDMISQQAYREWAKTLHLTARVRWHIGVVRSAPLSAEAVAFRVGVLLDRDKELWHKKYGDSMFAVPDDDDVSWSLADEIAWFKAREIRQEQEAA